MLEAEHCPGPEGPSTCLPLQPEAHIAPFVPTSWVVGLGDKQATLRSVNLSRLLSQATAYERWRAPIHPTLRQLAIASGPIVLICFPILAAIMNIARASLIEALRIGDPGVGLLRLLCGLLSLLMILDLVGLTVYVSMLIITSGLREARPHWHWVALGEAILGAAHTFVVALGAAIVALVVIIGLVLICLFAIAAIVALLGMAAAE